jgi:hypothetical protein
VSFVNPKGTHLSETVSLFHDQNLAQPFLNFRPMASEAKVEGDISARLSLFQNVVVVTRLFLVAS